MSRGKLLQPVDLSICFGKCKSTNNIMSLVLPTEGPYETYYLMINLP